MTGMELSFATATESDAETISALRNAASEHLTRG
jgi:hypothetical protein